MPTQTALVTGASCAVGEAAAERLTAAGYKVHGTSRRAARPGRRTVVADVVLWAAGTERPELRCMPGRLAGRVSLLRKLAPVALVDAGIREDLELDALAWSHAPVRQTRS